MDKDSPELQYYPWSKIKNPAIPWQHSGFGAPEEWRIQDAVSWTPGNSVLAGKLWLTGNFYFGPGHSRLHFRLHNR